MFSSEDSDKCSQSLNAFICQAGLSGSDFPLSLRLYGLEYPGYESYPGFDHIQDMVITCTQRSLIIYIPVFMTNTSIPVSDYWILFG